MIHDKPLIITCVCPPAKTGELLAVLGSVHEIRGHKIVMVGEEGLDQVRLHTFEIVDTDTGYAAVTMRYDPKTLSVNVILVAHNTANGRAIIESAIKLLSVGGVTGVRVAA